MYGQKIPLKQKLTDMNKYFITFVGLLIYFSLLNSCNNNLGNKINESTSDIAEFKQLVADWNKAHSSKDVGVFSNLFENSILFYGVQQDKNTCIESKLSFFKKYPDFYQQIFGDVQVEQINDNEVKCSFVKRVTVNQSTNDYPSYLIFKKSADSWKIVTEGDLVTDKNLAKNETTKNTTANQQDYYYEPTVSIISGTIKIETFFGPPGFGENPQTDSREDSYILNLDNSINIISKSKDIEEGDFNSTKYNIAKIQLTSTSGVKLTNYKNKFVRLTGTFFGAHTGHHHTDVLMDVKKIE
jgi:ketosteroid isomerase-like protein